MGRACSLCGKMSRRRAEFLLAALVCTIVIAIVPLLTPGAARADMTDPLERRLVNRVVEEAFPTATGIGAVSGDPPVAEVMVDEQLTGYLLSTYDTVAIGGFTGLPFDIVVGVDLEGPDPGRFADRASRTDHQSQRNPGRAPAWVFRTARGVSHRRLDQREPVIGGRRVRGDRQRPIDAVCGHFGRA